MTQDAQDLNDFALSASQQAFAALVRRHIDLVYSAALRQVRNHDLAQDVTQNVFIDLAAKAKSLRRQTVLGAWLLVATRYAARDVLRSESRRKQHERKAALMKQETGEELSQSQWDELAPHLDEALSRLSTADRQLIVLRYFEKRSAEETASVLGISPQAARQRSHRAIERLRGILQRRGARISAALLTTAVLSRGVSAAPAGFDAVVCAKVAGGTLAAASAGGIAMTKGAVIFMSLTKIKVVVVGLVLLLMIGGTVAYRQWIAPGHDRVIARAPSSSQALPSNPAATTSPIAPVVNDWHTRFNVVYGLADGQNVKLVKPPFIAERRAFLKNVPTIGGLAVDQCILTLEWSEKPKWLSFSGSPGSLAGFLQMGVRLNSYDLEEWGGKYSMRIPGDWVVRKDASVEEKLRGLEQILADELGQKVHFIKRRVPREVIVVRGKYNYRSIDDMPVTTGFEIVELMGKQKRPENEAILNDRTIKSFCQSLEASMLKRVINETDEPDAPIAWHDHHPGSDEIDQVLAKLAWQTSLTFSREQRDTDVWFMEEAKPK